MRRTNPFEPLEPIEPAPPLSYEIKGSTPRGLPLHIPFFRKETSSCPIHPFLKVNYFPN